VTDRRTVRVRAAVSWHDELQCYSVSTWSSGSGKPHDVEGWRFLCFIEADVEVPMPVTVEAEVVP